MPSKTPVWKETTIKLLPGEVWKDIPGFEGSYQASCLGRVRSLDREVPHTRLFTQFVKGRILKQSRHKNINLLGKKLMSDLRVSLARDGNMYYFNTRRLVYTTFVKMIDYTKDRCYVINKDGNGYNNAVDNLMLVSPSEKQKRVFTRKRTISYLSYADRSQWKTNGGTSRRKPVAQFSRQGKLMKEFVSIMEASKQTGCGEKEIIEVAKGKWKQTKGFVFKYIHTGKTNG